MEYLCYKKNTLLQNDEKQQMAKTTSKFKGNKWLFKANNEYIGNIIFYIII